MITINRRIAVLSLMLFASSVVLSACHVDTTPTPSDSPSTYVPGAWDTTPTAQPSKTAAPTASPSPTTTSPAPTAKPKATTKPKATARPKATANASPTTPAPAATTAPKPAPTKAYPNITLGKLAWSTNGCLYRWSGSGWQSKNLCRTILNGPGDYTYRDSTGHELFTAVIRPALKLVYWSDSKLVYQQYTNYARGTYQNGTFDAFDLHQASFDDGTTFSIDDFFNQTSRLAAFGHAHPTADLHRSTRDSQWFVFYNTWRPAILAGNCATNYLCPS